MDKSNHTVLVTFIFKNKISVKVFCKISKFLISIFPYINKHKTVQFPECIRIKGAPVMAHLLNLCNATTLFILF